MPDTTSDPRDDIKSQYGSRLAAQKAKVDETYNQNVAGYQKQLDDAPEQYQSMRNQAYTDNALAEQARKENMANMGLSGAGGTSQTLQQRNRTSLLGTLGDANRQQQDYTDNINLALGNLKTQYGADTLALEQQNDADLSAALTAYDQWKSGYDLSVDQYDLTKQNSVFDQAWAMLQKNRISKAEFELLTGFKLRR